MKAKGNALFSSALICVCLLLAPRGLNSQLAPLKLQAERTNDQLILRWDGALGVKLQQNTNLTNAPWVDVPGSDGTSSIQLPMTNPLTAFRLVDLRNADEGDGLDDWFETNGWTIFIDAHGYGTDGLVERHVASDPGLADSDGDGLDDFWEWITGSDPRSTDTDGDGLSDFEEWFRWHTSPTSVDTDGDARGPNHNLAPKAQLFDGNELSLLHTSPTLDDTDGDGRTDYEEYDQLGRSPLVAQLPGLAAELVDAVDIRLDVEYAEEAGTSREYGSELTTSTTRTDTHSSAQSVNASVKGSYATTIGLNPQSGWSVEVSVGWEGTWTSESSDARAEESSYSDYTTDSRTRTETAASGSMSAGIRLVNTGPVSFTLTDFGLTVRYLMPSAATGADRDFRTLATLVPTLGANGITLAPGDSTPVLQVQANGLNASRVKEFMARPNSLQLEPAFYELENAEGLNFDFLEEVTRWRTARVQIDFGDGRNEQYRVATNVERDEDGSYAGVTMGNVMSTILRIPFQTTNIQALVPAHESNERVLYSVRDLITTSVTNGFWAVFISNKSVSQASTHFEDLILRAGDDILITFVRDDDGDGLFAPEEQHYGTSETTIPDGPPPGDSDGDGLSDVFEARTGWDVVVLGRANHVYSDPRQADQDGDGLNDFQESQKGTDPTRPDTDNDGLIDAADPHPLVPARVLRVKWDAIAGGTNATNGLTWTTAFTNLQNALTLAWNGWYTTNDPNDDVAEIWVAAGVYKPTTTTNNRDMSFVLGPRTSMYGGFRGTETKLNQREADPLFNGTVLSGDLMNNDASTYGENPNSFAENSRNVCWAEFDSGSGVAILDGFTITGGNGDTGGGVFAAELPAAYITPGGLAPRLRNLLFRANRAIGGGGGLKTDPGLIVEDCLFLQNSADRDGGGIHIESASFGRIRVATVTNCQFIQNEVRTVNAAAISAGGGAVFALGEVILDRCLFRLNTSADFGGAVSLGTGAKARISRSRFLSNTGSRGGGGLVLYAGVKTVEVLQSIFVTNLAGSAAAGGAIYSHYEFGSGSPAVYILNSSFSRNDAPGGGGAIFNNRATILIENCASWGNPGGFSGTVGGSRVRTTCGDIAANWPGNGNINVDPLFVNAAAGDLRLQSGSPAIDAGNNYIDYTPAVPGFQPLPDTDIDGYPFWRVMDGNLDGTATVDMGAHERQGP